MANIDDTSEADVQCAALVLPAGEANRGGDFKWLKTDGPKTIVVVGDVEGNGEDAAPYADELCQELHRDTPPDDAVELLAKLNTRVYADSSFDRFVTVCVVVIDRPHRSAQWAFAGHLPPHWLDTGLPLDGARPGVPLGVDKSCNALSADRRPLRPREGMLLFTDGLEDVKGPGGDRFGSARITHALAQRLHGATPEEVVNHLKDVACDFGEGQLPDDLCLVALRIN
jgi:serine phosphatase RsbU (regulator of sigma subunit)